MIDLINAQNEFKKYANKYDMTLDGIERKYSHSFRVMKISTEIAQELNLTQEQIDLATLIGLLHDIARFEEFTRYDKFSVKNEFDHGDFAVEILKENDYIRKFIQTDKYDNIIIKAIKNHNKFEIENNLDEETLLYCKIIRDADKIDIFYEATEFFWTKKEEIEQIENGLILDSYYEQFIKKQPIFRVANQTIIDEIITCIAFIYDLNFKYSFEKLKTHQYIQKTLDRFKFKNNETENRIEQIRKVAEEFINRKCIEGN